jgi:hypothetical protein
MKNGFNPYPEWSPPVESPESTPEFYIKIPVSSDDWRIRMGRTRGPREEGITRAGLEPNRCKDSFLRDGDSIVVESKVGESAFWSPSPKMKSGVVWVSLGRRMGRPKSLE